MSFQVFTLGLPKILSDKNPIFNIKWPMRVDMLVKQLFQTNYLKISHTYPSIFPLSKQESLLWW